MTASLERNPAISSQCLVAQLRIGQFQFANLAVIPLELETNFARALPRQVSNIVEKRTLDPSIRAALLITLRVVLAAGDSGYRDQGEHASAGADVLSSSTDDALW